MDLFKKAITYTCIIAVTMVIYMKLIGQMEKENSLNIGIVGHWKSIHPGLQHTLVGDLTLSNQFEALVGYSENGTYVPLASKSWTISSDNKIFIFQIDTSRRFSDGVSLSASHFKNSWQTALKLTPKSSNNSLLDIMYKLEGFENFESTGDISGIVVNGESLLELHFKTPFRMAIEHLSGNRFAAFREENGRFLGTGAYTISEISTDTLKLEPNPFHPDTPQSGATLHSITPNSIADTLRSGQMDVVLYSMTSASISEDEDKIAIVPGPDALHKAVYLNSQKGRFFEKREHRQALQYLLSQHYQKNSHELGDQKYVSVDPQVYLPLQAGRISEAEVATLISEGEKHVEALLAAAKKNPPVLLEPQDSNLSDALRAVGLAISKESKKIGKGEIYQIIYRGEAADLVPGNFGVAMGDPDGIYHKLGAAGAITSPMTRNQKVEHLLEEGRSINDRAKLDTFYKNVSRVILSEVPLVHVGFNKVATIYRADKVIYHRELLRRNEGHVTVFSAK
jgi:ABC-type transport system substrate-binding protein